MIHDIRRQQFLLVLRWVCYALLLIVCYALQTNTLFFRLGGIRPIWLLAACIALSAFEEAFPSALYGLFAGLLWDFSSNRLVGFFAIALMALTFGCCSLIRLVLRRSPFNVCALCLASAFLATGLDFLFTYVLYAYPNCQTYYIGTVIPTIIYTAVVCLPLYALCSRIGRIGREKN